ncbi:deoxyribonuclease IV [Geovibrio thiophilus]|uniref:Probable endonuclease 4 n=1 Tax=Geovibrio thiophilus TaxID=139438 RepID=A0A410JYM8_9BACT|nr:deoxyribonuclease IV [Geovibrio thiophilus]QAR33233.1 deoxyribonuclease IV [Geovibrio thiophilus]
MRIGAHQSISGGIYKSIERALHDGCEALQVFVRNASRWESKPLNEKDAEKFRQKAEDFGTENICAHASYLINLASASGDIYSKSLKACADELSRCGKLGIPYYVIHPGSFTGSTLEDGIRRIAVSLDRIYHENGFRTMTLLEITAGQGSSVGCSFEHMEEIINLASCSEKIGLCLDSCHMFSAGYDIVNDYDSVFDSLSEKFGDKIRVFHLNDAKKPLGSRVDRHAMIGKGEIGEEFFRKAVNESGFGHMLGILETPIGEGSTYASEVNLLKSYRI